MSCFPKCQIIPLTNGNFSKSLLYFRRNDSNPLLVLNGEAERCQVPFFEFVGGLHVLNVHADFVFDVRREAAGVRLEVFKDNGSPEGTILQKLQGSAHQTAFRGGRLKLIQV